MKIKTIRLFVVRHNFSAGNREVIFDGLATIQKNTDGINISYIEEEDNTEVELVVESQKVTLKRKTGEFSTRVNCLLNKLSEIKVINKYGHFSLNTYTHHIEQSRKKLAFIYDVVSGNEVVDSYRFDWKWEDKYSE